MTSTCPCSLSLALALKVPPLFFSLFSPQISVYNSCKVCCPFPASQSLSLFPHERQYKRPDLFHLSVCLSLTLYYVPAVLSKLSLSLSLFHTTTITFILSKFQLLCRTPVSSQQLCWLKWDTFKLYLLLGIRVFYWRFDSMKSKPTIFTFLTDAPSLITK